MSEQHQIARTSRGLTSHLFEELEALRNGKSTPQHARAVASLANTVCTVSRLEMDFARFVAASRTEEDGEDPMGRVKSLPMD